MFYLGEPAQPAEPPTNVLVTENDKHADCWCRGGVWKASGPGDVYGFCVPGTVPTGKYYNIATRGCLPLPGWPEAQIHDVPEHAQEYKPESLAWLWWAIGIGAAVVIAPLAVRAIRRRRKARKGMS